MTLEEPATRTQTVTVNARDTQTLTFYNDPKQTLTIQKYVDGIVVVGAGPTLNYYQPIKGAIHIGVNGTYHCKNINLDYYFIQDFVVVEGDGSVSLPELRELNCKKFVGQYIKKLHQIQR